MVPDWISPERVERLARDLRRVVNPIRELLGPDKTMVRAHNLLGKTRCVDDLVCDPRLLALAQGVLGYKIQVSVVVMFDLLSRPYEVGVRTTPSATKPSISCSDKPVSARTSRVCLPSAGDADVVDNGVSLNLTGGATTVMPPTSSWSRRVR